ncbi:hypothetical protein Neosp_003494 [[Neocosmospora] mangrovei]
MANQPREESCNDSPYYGATRRFKFNGGEIACVPQELVNKYPDFAGWINTQPDNEPIKFDVTGRVGHTIVHFLFTETYEALPSTLKEQVKEPSGAFIEALEVYHQAVIDGLEELAELATEEIEHQGRKESFANIVKGVSSVEDLFEGDKTWLLEYLAKRATMDHEDVTQADISDGQDIDLDHPLVDILLEANMKLKLQLQQTEESEASSTE